jgi:hypothetical protein
MSRDFYRHIRSAILEKRPLSTSILDGELAINYHTDSVGVFLRDTSGKIRKIGPAHVGTLAPIPINYTDLSDGELWVDKSTTTPVLRYYDASEDEWVSSSILDSPLGTNEIIVGDPAGAAKTYALDTDSFLVDNTVGSLEVRLADNVSFGSYRFVSETGTGLRTSVFRTVVGSGDSGWVELESYDKTLYRSGKYLAEIVTDTGSVHITELLMCHNGTDTFYTEYGAVGSTADPLGEFQAAIVNVAGTDLVSLQFRRAAGVTGTVTIRTSQASLF